MNEEKELPEGWVRVKLEEALFPGGTYNPRTGGDGEFLYVDIEAVDNKKQKIVSPKCILNAEAPSRARMAIKAGDIIFSLVRPYLKNIAVVPLELDGQVASTAYCVMRPENGISSSFIFFSLLRESFINSIKTYGGTPPAARDDEFLSMTVPIAPLPEQHRIVSAIEERFTILDAVATALQQNKQKLKLARASVLKHAVEGKLTEKWRAEHPATESGSELLGRILAERRAKWEADQLAKGKDPRKLRYEEPTGLDVSELQELPEKWCWATVAQLASPDKYALAIGPFGSNLKVEDYRNEGVPLVFVRNIRSNTFDGSATRYITIGKADELRPHQIKGGDILITKMGDPPGDACMYPDSKPTAVITADCIKWTLSLLLLHRRFFVNAINSFLMRKQILEITQGVAQLKVSLGRFEHIAIPLPPLAEQGQIVAEVERRLSVIEQAEAAIETSLKRIERARQSILERAFSGRLVPQDPRDEPASVLLERIQEERGKRLAEGKLRGKNGGVKAARVRKTKEEDFVPQWQLLRDAKQSGAVDGSLSNAGVHEDGASKGREVGQGEIGKEELGDLVQMPLLSLWD